MLYKTTPQIIKRKKGSKVIPQSQDYPDTKTGLKK